MADSLTARALATIQRWLYPDPLQMGVGGSTQPAHSLYDARNALSAMAAFPWVLACLDVISTDLSGVPLVAVRETANGGREIVRDHPVLSLLRRPSPQTGGVAMRRQLYADYAAVRESYIRVIGQRPDGSIEPGAVMLRLHPYDVEPQVNTSTGLIQWFRWGDAQKLQPSEVLMIRGIGWERGVRSARAVSPIQALSAGLLASKEARDHARKSAKRGQIQFMVTPSDPLAMFGPGGVAAIVDEFNKAAESGSGVIVLNRALKLDQLSISPRELEFAKLSEEVRNEILAVFGVPPTIIGIPGASYGTARQEARVYWERLGAIARLFDDEFSRLTGDPRVRIEHDFTDVEALQTSRTERQMRASVWVTGFGVSPRAAAAYEGFDDAPIPATVTADDVRAPRPNAAPVIEPQEDRAFRAVRGWLDGVRIRAPINLHDGIDSKALADLEAHRLRADLLSAGLEFSDANDRAKSTAWLVVEAVRLAMGSVDDGGTMEVHHLRVFGDDFARMVTA